MPSHLSLVAILFAAASSQSPAIAPPEEPGPSVAAFLELPELFQVAKLSGAMAVLRHLAPTDDAACFARWPVPEDVLAIFADYVRQNPQALPEAFAPTLLAALRQRCAHT